MTEKIVSFILGLFSGIKSIPFGREIIAALISMSPVLELRGGIIAGRALGMAPIPTFIICYIANLIPVPFILWFMKKILEKFRKSNIKFLNKISNWLYNKAQSKKDTIEKYGFWGVVLFVGIPLPGTGAWTGCLVASVFDMDKKKTFLATMLGVLIAGIIISVLSMGLFDVVL